MRIRIGLMNAAFILFICVLVSYLTAYDVYAEYTDIRRDTQARVIQVIDGDALKVELSNTKTLALVRMAGVFSKGFNDSLQYITAQLLGRDVDLRLDENWDGTLVDGRWTPVYVYYNDNLYNQVLLQKGLACVDEDYALFTMYETFLSEQQLARSREIGLWSTGRLNPYAVVSVNSGNPAYIGNRVDVNTATAEELREAAYPAGMTINKAWLVVDARVNGYTFKSLGELQKISGIRLTDTQMTKMADYLYVDTSYYTYINLNTASRQALTDAGFSKEEASAILSAQRRGMRCGADIPIELGTLNDKVTLYTNINRATVTELLSLSEYMTSAFASELVAQAASQPFEEMEDVRAFFEEHDESTLYNEIVDYIILW